jgi:excisionase family DNA binding protein
MKITLTEPSPVPEPLLVNRDRLGLLLGVTSRTIATWDDQGLIPAVRIGRAVRYDPSDVLAHLKRVNAGRKAA